MTSRAALIATAMACVASFTGVKQVDRSTAPSQPVQMRSFGSMTYIGPSTWRGVVYVERDHVLFHDGEFTANLPGIPQGITFSGNRRNIGFKDLTFNGVGDGLNLANNQRADDIILDTCKFLDCRSPDGNAKDPLLGHRGSGMYVAKGRNWTIRDCVFKTKVKDPANLQQRDWSTQYAARLGEVHGLKVSDTRFENWAGKSSVWLMFVHDATFERAEFSGGPLRIGARPNEMPNVALGDCRNIAFRDCQFTFGDFYDWPASILLFPGSENITFENCRFNTVEGCGWWIDIDARSTKDITWKNCTWNGKAVEGFTGVRTELSEEEMKAKGIGAKE